MVWYVQDLELNGEEDRLFAVLAGLTVYQLWPTVNLRHRCRLIYNVVIAACVFCFLKAEAVEVEGKGLSQMMHKPRPEGWVVISEDNG